MDIISGFVDMAKTPEEMKEDGALSNCDYAQPIYPWGLCMRLDNDSLKKVNLSPAVDAGDIIVFQAVGKVTSVSKRETDKGSDSSVEIQITHLALGEEEKEEAPRPKIDYRKMYKE